MGVLTLNVRDSSETKIMIRFRISGGKYKSSYNSFSVGLPEVSKSIQSIMNNIEKKRGDFYKTVIFSEENKPEPTFCYPSKPRPGEFNLGCYIGNGSQCRCLVVVSKTPEDDVSEA